MRTYQIIIDDMICRWGYSKQYVRDMLAKCKGHVDMRISSLGGDLDHGLDIRQQLIDHGDVTVYLTGFVASAATIVAMGAKKVCMSKYAMFLVHKCSNYIDAWGNYNADQMQQLIDELERNKRENEKIDAVIAQLYSQKTGKSISELLQVLKEGRWLTAKEALDYGFVDELTEDENDAKQNFTSDLRSKFNAFGLPVTGIEAAAENETKSLTRLLLDFFKSIAGKTDQISPKETNQTEITNQKSPAMIRLACFSSVMAALSVKDLPLNEDGSVTLSQSEMETINSRLSSLADDVAARDNTIAALNAQVENLKNLPGDDTKDNLDDTVPVEMSAEDMYNLSNQFLD